MELVVPAMPKRNADIEAGLFFTLFGGLTAALSLQYNLGTIAAMGPGLFPLMLGTLLAVIGLVIFIKGILFGGEEARSLPLWPIILITASLLVFAFLLLTVGLTVAVPAQVFIALRASQHFTVKRAIALSLGLLAFCYVVFVYLLGIPVPMIGI
ncbi:tripartite tricarboxylate transporter TctB family protein [Roseiarcaceae bacterium H3SJ34-1]|uniref:tripartite tricarboxylate transporter TctB family protein n=1 Tax=Terripilifer ovatus TaxID=3032367 RepID=UPI003AB98542|nr:tripartite tricarboxylate transporter TctB family protein [Roseiarcaceae bacterium H3SJ34-1]